MARFKIDGDSRGSVKAAEDLAKAQAEIANEAEDAAKALTKTEKAAQRIKEANDPQQRYNRQVKETARLVKQGAISVEEAQRAVERYGRRLDRNATKQRQAFGGPALSQIKNYVAGLASISGAVQLIKATFDDMRQSSEAAANNAFAAIGAQGELQQLSTEKQGQINEFGKSLIKRGIFSPEQRGKAFETSFLLESAGFSDGEKQVIATAGQTRFVSPDNLVEFGGRLRKVQNVFGEERTGNFEATLDQMVVAAAATQSDASKIAGVVPEFGAGVVAGGFDFREAMAAFVEIEKRSPNEKQAATRFSRFLEKVDQRDFIVNDDLTDTLDALQSRLDAGESEFDLMPEVRAREGMRALLQARAAGDITAGEQDIIGAGGAFRAKAGTLAASDPSFAASLHKAAAEGSLADRRDRMLSERELLVDAIIARRQERILASGQEFRSSARGIGLEAQRYLGGSNSIIREELEIAEAQIESGRLQPNEDEARFLQSLRDYLARTADASERTAAAAEAGSNQPEVRAE